MIQLTIDELAIIFLFFSLISIIFLSISIYLLFIYNQRKIVYPLFEARDSLINCVAKGNISEDDELFEIYYTTAVELIKVTHTNFFSLDYIIKIMKDKNLTKEIMDNNIEILDKLKTKNENFQNAVILLFEAMKKILIKKNKFLAIIIFIHSSKILFKLGSNLVTDRIKKFFSKISNYDDYNFIDNNEKYISKPI